MVTIQQEWIVCFVGLYLSEGSHSRGYCIGSSGQYTLTGEQKQKREADFGEQLQKLLSQILENLLCD